MSVIAVGGFQHETNTFAPSKADYTAFEQGGGWPPLTFGDAIAPRLSGANIPAAGAFDALHAAGHRTIGLAWGAASPSAQVTRDAFERIVGEMLARLQQAGAVDGVYLDLHGAMVTEHLDDGEGEILARVRKVVGARVPIVASLDLHANVTRAMIAHADGLVACFTEACEMREEVFEDPDVWQGHEGIRGLMKHYANAPGFPGRQHHVTQVQYRPQADGSVRMRGFAFVTECEGEPPYVLRFTGYYLDKLVKTDGQWLFSERIIRLWDGEILKKFPGKGEWVPRKRPPELVVKR